MIVLPSNGQEGYNLTRSLRFRASASAYLSRTPASAGNRQKWTFSTWIKRGVLSSEGRILSASDLVSNEFFIEFNSSNGITVYDTNSLNLVTTAVYRDPSAWYHVVVSIDTTQATAANRCIINVNGVQVTSLSTATYPAQNANLYYNQATANRIISGLGNNLYFDGYLAEVNFIDGQALTPSSFGSTNSTTGVWQPARYTGTYGTNGFYLPFTDNSALTTSSNVGLGKDFSGNANYWVTNNISITAGVTYDSMTDVPTLTSATAANFCVLSPIDNSSNGVQVVLSNANLDLSLGSGQGRATFSVSSGKWYWEITSGATNQGMYGIIKQSVPIASATFSSADGYYYWASSGAKYNNGAGVAYGSGLASGDILGVAFDASAGTLTYYKNNVSLGVAFSGLSGTFSPAFCQGNTTAYATFNFGQRPFSYTPPTGFVALNTYNLPDSTIKKGNTVMDATLYTGNGSSGKAVTNTAGFKPDLVWVKDRSAANFHLLTDSVRGVGLALYSNGTFTESAYNAQTLQSFNSGGFTVGSNGDVNTNANSYVGWQWQAGQGTTSSNTSGTITSTVSVNASAGFSVVTYTGTGANATVGHGLGVAPKMVIVKQRSASGQNWSVYHVSMGNTSGAYLNTGNGSVLSSGFWNNTSPTSSIFSIGNGLAVNDSGVTYVAYCFSEIQGFSSFGLLTGNGSADGTFVNTGSRPKFLLVKRIDSSSDWIIYDTSRDLYNVAQDYIAPNASSAESTVAMFDILSNGFKFRFTNATWNVSGGTYIYYVASENPFKNSLAR